MTENQCKLLVAATLEDIGVSYDIARGPNAGELDVLLPAGVDLVTFAVLYARGIPHATVELLPEEHALAFKLRIEGLAS